MSRKNDEALAAARAEIARVKARGEVILDLGVHGPLGDAARDLILLPDEIAELTGITTLALEGTQVSDLSPIAGMTGMTGITWLDLSRTQVSDLSPIAGMTGITGLYLSGTKVSDLSPIARMTGITTLDLSGTQVSDLNPIAGMTGITSLHLSGTQVSDLRPIAGMTGMTRLFLYDTQVSNLSPIVGITGITWLNLDGTQVSDLRPIAGMTGITRLYLSGTKVSDLSPIAGMTGITRLGLSRTQVSDLSPIAGMRLLAEKPELGGLRFEDTPATRNDPRLAEIAEIEDDRDRARALFEYLEQKAQSEADRAVEEAMEGPVLSEALADLTERDGRFHAVSLQAGPERPADQRHDELLQVLQFASGRFDTVEAQNRIGRAIVANFRDYAAASRQEPLNPRVLNYLANGIRGALADEMLAAPLDGLDTAAMTEFLAEHDALIREYYPRALIGVRFQVETPPERLARDLLPKLAAARELIGKADAAGLLAPNVSTTAEIVERRAEGARRGFMTLANDEQRKAAGEELRRDAVLATGFIGRILGRVRQWTLRQSAVFREHPLESTAVGFELYHAAKELIDALTPIFAQLWQLIGNLRLPF